MTWKYLPVVLLAGAILAVSTADASALGLRKNHGGAVGGACGACAVACAPCETPYVAPAPVAKKMMVTVYEAYETEETVKVWKTFSKEEKYMAYRCETVAVPKKVMVTYYKMVPRDVEKVVVRCERVMVPEDVVVTKCVWVPKEEVREVIRCTYKPVEEMRDVTHYVSKCVPVPGYVTRCVDKGGHYECREVACSTGSVRHGLFRHHNDCDCPPPVSLVSVYVPNYVTEQVPVTTYKMVCTPVTEKVKVITYQRVETPEKVKVTVCHLEEIKQTVRVMRCQLVEKKETIHVTVCECVAVPKEETVTCYESKMVPYEAVRMVCHSELVEQKVKAIRYKPVEKEVTVYESPCADSCGGCASYVSSCSSGRRHGLFRH